MHYTVLLLVIFQILGSEFLDVHDGVISSKVIEFLGTWLHIIVGLLLFVVALIFIIVELSKHGFSYFFPYLFKDTSQLKSDINQIKKMKIPELAPKGLAAIVQGLGLGALFIVVASGTLWFVVWIDNPLGAHALKEIHETLTILIEAFVVGHGSMGLLHLFMVYRKQKPIS